MKCKILRQLESNGESSHKIDKTRAVVKDLHSRIRVAIHRIDSISKRIEDLRDKELQPQLEELIEGYVLVLSSLLNLHKYSIRNHILLWIPIIIRCQAQMQLKILIFFMSDNLIIFHDLTH